MNIRSDGMVARPVLSGLTLTDGVFTATLSEGPERPVIDATIDGRTVGTATLKPRGDGRLEMRAPLPRQCLCDGDSVVVFRDRTSGTGLARYLVSSGDPRLGNLQAELAALRAEFSALKRAFLAEAWHEKLHKVDRPVIVAEVLEAVERHLREREMGRDG